MVFRRLDRLAQIFKFSILLLLLSACGTHTFHQVRPNDTLYSISWNYNQDYKELAKWNDLEAPFVIKPGEWLRVVPPTRDAWGNPQPALPDSRLRKVPVAKIITKDSPSKSIIIAKVNPVSVSGSTKKSTWIWPSKGKVIRQYDLKQLGRQGIDIAAALGDEVLATSAGKVVYSGNGLRGYGNLIIIKHNAKYLSAYAHNQRRLVKEGDTVKQGQVIAYVGQTEADRIKLHFQIRIDGKPVDPLRYLPK